MVELTTLVAALLFSILCHRMMESWRRKILVDCNRDCLSDCPRTDNTVLLIPYRYLLLNGVTRTSKYKDKNMGYQDSVLQIDGSTCPLVLCPGMAIRVSMDTQKYVSRYIASIKLYCFHWSFGC